MASLLCLILILLWTTEGSSLSLTSSPSIIGRNGTQNLTMTCFMDELNETHSDVSAIDVSKMRILKLNIENSEWNLVIEMERTWVSPNIFMDGLEGSVSIDARGINHLQVTWSLANDVTAGQYTCDIIGYTRNQQPVGQRSPSIILDVEASLTLYQLYSMYQTSRKKLDVSLENIATNKAILDQSLNTLDVLSQIFIEQWPQGLYGLLQPESGCPADVGVIWQTGNVTHYTESQARNKDAVSSPAHMKKPYMWTDGTTKLMKQHLCNVDIQSTGRLWPEGSYCINHYTPSYCPLGFNIGTILWDEEDTNAAYDSIMIAYCCRNDSSPQTPIHLPRRKPFYLYRYGGSCQEVVGMKVTPENMFFDTKCCKSRYADFAPDGANSLPDVKLHLCYYESLDQSNKSPKAMSSVYFSPWPQGVYGLLQPEAGCPADVGVTWKYGHRTHHTQSQGTNTDAVSSPAHMKKPIMWTDGSSKFMRQYFCSVDKQSTGRLWPAGSYCVNRYKHETCPLGFKDGNGYILWDDENTSNKNDVSGTHPVNNAFDGSDTDIYYCCRNDSSPQTPLYLPRRKPFYLYRHGGTCQEVVDMKVTPEYMFFDTENTYSGYFNDVPDGKESLPDVKLHLCYYEATYME